MIGGPLLGLYLMGVLYPCVNEKVSTCIRFILIIIDISLDKSLSTQGDNLHLSTGEMSI